MRNADLPPASRFVSYSRFIALGDSLSADLYPARAVAGDVAAAAPHDDLSRGLGAAALLYRNDRGRWPALAGQDLETRFPGIRFQNEHWFDHPARHPTDHLATSGSTTVSVLAYQLPRVAPSEDRVLVTLTVGRDDALRMLGAPRPPAALVATMAERAGRVLETICTKLPNADVLVTTVVDPTSGTGTLDAETDVSREIGWIEAFNDELRQLVAATPGTRLADAHRHFLGHGVAAPPDERWVWPPAPFELNDRGASELRRVWWETLTG